MPKPKNPVKRSQAVSTHVGIKGAKVGKAPSWIKPDEATREMGAFLAERKQAEDAAQRVGTPAQQAEARDSTQRGFRNLMRKKYGG